MAEKLFTIRRYIFLLALVLYIFSSSRAEAQESKISLLDPDSFSMQYNQEVFAILIDARVAEEFQKSRIAGAISIPSKEELSAFSDTLDLELPLYIYCSSETRSTVVAEFLLSKEFSNLIILKGGFLEWKALKFPIDKKKKKDQ